jgi:hypothetical protein
MKPWKDLCKDPCIWPKSRTLAVLNVVQPTEQQNMSFSADGNKRWYRHFGTHFVVSYKAKQILMMWLRNPVSYPKKMKAYVHIQTWTWIFMATLFMLLKFGSNQHVIL